MLLQVVCIALLLVIEHSVDIDAECCYKCSQYLCKDCTAGTPYCGYGPCNIFGCACRGGCRKGLGCHTCRKRSPFVLDNETSSLLEEQSKKDSEKHLEAIFALADKDGDGKLDVLEAKFWALKSRLSHTSRRMARSIDVEFSRLDIDNDGFLTRWEIDH